jgi:hypothetical protein
MEGSNWWEQREKLGRWQGKVRGQWTEIVGWEWRVEESYGLIISTTPCYNHNRPSHIYLTIGSLLNCLSCLCSCLLDLA